MSTGTVNYSTSTPATTTDEGKKNKFIFVFSSFSSSSQKGEEWDSKTVKYGGEEYLDHIKREKEVDAFLNNMRNKAENEGYPSYSVVMNFENLWLELQHDFEAVLTNPTASLSMDDSITLTYRFAEHYIEFEVFDDRTELFYENEISGQTYFQEIPKGLSIIDKVDELILDISL
ncbi:hypothetical protein [Rhodohalobacter sulfatireducens]|uniref:Uncharacterized protein n=1 Tax=Rhodohalobacter sulfatireducens TaxID=2911366 RepID=A0ABS9KE56_9BACT|nr:hypothetical protein [Rhodohalobacter sulfatireducens]MCG2589123.1 hypothetical protein [Rhodohalobacter sulfatireducens]